MELAFDILLILVACFWLGFTLVALLGFALMRSLPKARLPSRASLTVIVAVRDEVERIEGTIRRILAQEGIDLQLIVADDGSQDGSREILHALDAAEARLEVIEIDELPAGWIGKCHACHLAASRARHDWLLFTDADTWMRSDLLTRAVAEAERLEVDQLCLVPGLAGTSFVGRILALTMVLGLYKLAIGINLHRPASYTGFGSFNLIRRRAYEAAGGHETLRMEVLEDIRLGEQLKRAGFQSHLGHAQEDFEVKWLTDFWSFFRVLEKNYFALLNYRIGLLILQQLSCHLLWTLAILGPFFFGLPGMLAGIGLASMALPAALTAPLYSWTLLPALFTPLAVPITMWGLLHSAYSMLSKGGVRWRGRFYPMAELRRS